MSKYLLDNAAVEIYDHRHWKDIAAGKDTCHKEFCIERVRQIIESAGG